MEAGGGGPETSVTARIRPSLLAMALIATACQTTSSEPEEPSSPEPEEHSSTALIESTTTSSTTPEPLPEVTTTTAAPQRLHPVRVGCSTALPAFPCSALIDGSLETDWQAPNGTGSIDRIQSMAPEVLARELDISATGESAG